MSAVAHFFVAVSGSFIHERMAQLFIDIYMIVTIKDSQGHDIYSEVVNGLREKGYVTNNLETRQHIRQRQ